MFLVLVMINVSHAYSQESFVIKEIIQSGFLDSEDPFRYQAINVIDNDLKTVWAYHKDMFTRKEKIEFKFATSILIDEIRIAHGYFDERYFYKNNRIKKISIRLKDKTFINLNCEDVMEFQSVILDEEIETDNINFAILDYYKGSEWSDICISEIEFYYRGEKLRQDFAIDEKNLDDKSEYNYFYNEDKSIDIIKYNTVKYEERYESEIEYLYENSRLMMIYFKDKFNPYIELYYYDKELNNRIEGVFFGSGDIEKQNIEIQYNESGQKELLRTFGVDGEEVYKSRFSYRGTFIKS